MNATVVKMNIIIVYRTRSRMNLLTDISVNFDEVFYVGSLSSVIPSFRFVFQLHFVAVRRQTTLPSFWMTASFMCETVLDALNLLTRPLFNSVKLTECARAVDGGREIATSEFESVLVAAVLQNGCIALTAHE
jgi:hypothetical protein